MPESLAAPVWTLLFDSDPYEGFPIDEHELDMQGWGADNDLFDRLVEVVAPSLIVEVGCWKGRSSIRLAEAVDVANLDCQILCVDTWLGSPEHWLVRDRPDYYASLGVKHGRPQLYLQFLANVIHTGHAERITPLPQTSDNAAVIIAKLGLRPELIYIDAAHEYESVRRDLDTYWELLADDGVLFGDDYGMPKWQGVTQAVNAFAAEKRIAVIGERGKFVIAKGNAYKLSLAIARRA